MFSYILSSLQGSAPQENARASREAHVSFRVQLSRDFSRLSQMES